MCVECHNNICPSGCPNADEHDSGVRCSLCWDNIPPGDEYAHIEGKIYCLNCIDDMPPETLLRLCGYPVVIAEL